MASEKLTSNDGDVPKCDFEMGESKSIKPGQITVSRLQAGIITIVVIAIVVMVGLVCFFQTKRNCDSDHVFGNEQNVAVTTDKPGSTMLSSTTDESANDKWTGRLPRAVIPEYYNLHIKPYINEVDVEGSDKQIFTFDGRVRIRIRCDVETNEIMLHMSDIEVIAVTLDAVNEENVTGNHFQEIETSHNKRFSILTITLSKSLERDRHYNLDLTYQGQIRDALSGFYRSSYFDNEGNRVWLATTQFEPVDARYALPCFDEPDMKAVFNVTITHPSQMMALSNGRETAINDHGDGWSTTVFEPTPLMSTYLLAFVVSEFEYRETITSGGVRLRTWSRPNAIDTTSYALQAASSLMTRFEEYFDIPYHISKLDMICVPDFGAGAMENWGLIIYHEDTLLYDPDVDSRSDQETVLTTISHELAHQWFGNLVTMRWWDDLWLNEGFGTYFGYVGANFYQPELRLLDTLVSRDFFNVLKGDSLADSHPITADVKSPEEIDMIFDDISYTKGAAVLRMLHNILGEDVFQRGIRNHLKTFNYSNAESDDLWESFTRADKGSGNTNVKDVMDTWTRQMGYPLVSLTRVDRRTVRAAQGRYLTDREGGSPSSFSPFGYVWSVYLTYTHNGARNYDSPPSLWLTDADPHEFTLDNGVTSEDWLLANINAYGFYRINYEADNWAKLVQQLRSNHSVLPVLNRVQLLQDSFSLALNGNLSLATAFDLISYLQNELSSGPWSVALRYFMFFRDMLGGSSLQGLYEAFLTDLTSPLYQRLGLDVRGNFSTVDEENTRQIILPIACKVGNRDCVRQALELFQNFKSSYNISDSSSNRLETSTMDTVFCVAIREGGFEVWDYVMRLYTDPRTSRAYTRKWLDAMSCSLRPWQIKRLLEYIMNTPGKERQIVYALPRITGTSVGGLLAWDFFRAHWDTLSEMYGTSFRMRLMIEAVTSKFNTNLQLQELTTFANAHELGAGTAAIHRAIRNTQLNIAMFEELRSETEEWLEGHNQRTN